MNCQALATMNNTAVEIIPITRMGSSLQDPVQQDQVKMRLDVANETTEEETRGQSLPIVDGGKPAWLFLGSCYLLEVSTVSAPNRLATDNHMF
jgi:hypothetical protein